MSLFVIARNSSFTYKGKAVDVKQVGRELGVRYVLEGSVRKAGNRVRITGQLIEAATGAHIWADRFDGELEDVFDLQDQVTTSVVGRDRATARTSRDRARATQADREARRYDYYLRGAALFITARRWSTRYGFSRAIERDPEFAAAYGMVAWDVEARRGLDGCRSLQNRGPKPSTCTARGAIWRKMMRFALSTRGHVVTYRGDLYDDGVSHRRTGGRAQSESRHRVVFARMGLADVRRNRARDPEF